MGSRLAWPSSQPYALFAQRLANVAQRHFTFLKGKGEEIWLARAVTAVFSGGVVAVCCWLAVTCVQFGTNRTGKSWYGMSGGISIHFGRESSFVAFIKSQSPLAYPADDWT